MKVGRRPASRTAADDAPGKATAARRRGGEAPAAKRRTADGPARTARPRPGARAPRPQESRGPRQGPQTAPTARPSQLPARPKTTGQAKARSKARKAKAPKAIRLPLRERLLTRLAGVDLRPQTLLAKVPFVVLVIAALALGLGITLWLSTDSAQRSYQLGSARSLNDALAQQKEALQRDVLEAQSAPALADAARDLGMIPSTGTAHLVQDPGGNWFVVGQPKPAEGAPPPPLNTRLPEEMPPAPDRPASPAVPKPGSGAAAEVPVRLTPTLPGIAPPGITLPGIALPGIASPGIASPGAPSALAGAEVPVALPPVVDPFSAHAQVAATLPGPPPLPGPAADTLITAPGAPVEPALPTVPAVPPVPPVPGVAAGAPPGGPQ